MMTDPNDDLDGMIESVDLSGLIDADEAEPTPEIVPDERPLEEREEARVKTAADILRNQTESQYMAKRRVVEDSEHWVAICFISRADKEAFLVKYALESLGDKYIDGYEVDNILEDR